MVLRLTIPLPLTERYSSLAPVHCPTGSGRMFPSLDRLRGSC